VESMQHSGVLINQTLSRLWLGQNTISITPHHINKQTLNSHEECHIKKIKCQETQIELRVEKSNKNSIEVRYLNMHFFLSNLDSHFFPCNKRSWPHDQLMKPNIRVSC
jgi:hypothetical protein